MYNSNLDRSITRCPWCGRELETPALQPKVDDGISRALLEELVVRMGELIEDKLNVDRFEDRWYWDVYTEFRNNWYKRQGS